VGANLSAVGGLARESSNDAASWLNGAPPHLKQGEDARVRIYEVDPVNSLFHKVGPNLLCKEPILTGLFADIL
jgi:hypothetical protein